MKTPPGPTSLADRRQWEKRFPIIPLVSTVLALQWIAFLVLVRFDLSNGRNGLTTYFWVQTFNLFALYSFQFQRKIIRLGKKIIPLWRIKLETSASSPSHRNDSMNKLEYFDPTLQAIVVLQVIAIVVQFVFGLVLGFVLVGDFVYIQVSFAFQALYFFLTTYALVYQIHRVAACIRSSTIDQATRGQVLQKINSQQLHFAFIGGTGTIVSVLLAAEVIRANWYMIFYCIVLEGSMSAVPVIEFTGRLLFGHRRTKNEVETQEGIVPIDSAPSNN